MDRISSLSRHQDTVEYHIYFDDIPVDPANAENISSTNSDVSHITLNLNGEAVTMPLSAYLLSMRQTLLQYVSPMLSKYLWASEPFNLQVWNPFLQPQFAQNTLDDASDSANSTSADLSSQILNSFTTSTKNTRQTHEQKGKPHRFPNCPHLYGSVHFGDSLNDEWLVTYLLLALTARFPFLTIRVTDATEHYLLTHCPNIPDWYVRSFFTI